MKASAMGQVLTYFREHRWQRRMLTFMLAAIVAMILGTRYVPVYLDHRHIEQLGSDDPQVRSQAMATLQALARTEPDTRQRLYYALATPSETRFRAVQEILDATGHWPAPKNGELWQDRLRALTLPTMFLRETVADPRRRAETLQAARQQRQAVLHEAILAHRDNRYVHDMLMFAAGDPEASVRQAAASLAGVLGRDDVLRKLLGDAEPAVAATVALVAGLTGQDLTSELRDRLFRAVPEFQRLSQQLARDPGGPYLPEQDRQHQQDLDRARALRALIANSYLALLTRSSALAPQAADLARQTRDPVLQEQLLWILSTRARPDASRLLSDLGARYRWTGQPVSPGMLVAARRLRDDTHAAAALDILRRAASNETDGLKTSHIIAAIDYARALAVPCRREAYDLITTLWNPDDPVLLSRAATLLAQQAALNAQPAGDAPSRQDCLDLLRQAATYSTARPGPPEETRRSPFASAHAAVAQWLLDPSRTVLDLSALDANDLTEVIEIAGKKGSGFYLYQAVAVDPVDPGDVVAWRLAASDLPQAFDIGRAFLPTADMRYREYNARVRATGMQLLALTASPEQRRDIRRQIAAQLPRETYLGRGAAQCALLMLGDASAREEVRFLLTGADFPRRRALTALFVDGDRWALDFLLWNVYQPLEHANGILTGLNLNEVLAVTAPELPRPDVALRLETQLWQTEILKQVYGLFRPTLKLGGRP